MGGTAITARSGAVDVWFQIDVHRVSVFAVKPPTPEQRRTEIQQKLAELKRIQEEADSLEEKIERENVEQDVSWMEAPPRRFELTTGPTFWDEYGKFILTVALGALIYWITDGEVTEWGRD